MNKIAVVTAMTNGYDNIEPPDVIDEDFDYYFFTDTPNIDIPRPFKTMPLSGEVEREDKHVKITPEKYLKGYDYIVWMDSSMKQVGLIKPLLYLMDCDLAVVLHKGRGCIVQELDACAFYKKDNLDTMSKQVQGYINEGFPLNYGLWECGFIIKRINEKTKDFSEFWLNEVLTKSKRDQLSFPYSVWKKGMDLNWLHPSTTRGRQCVIRPHK